jgi:hypothetical protein
MYEAAFRHKIEATTVISHYSTPCVLTKICAERYFALLLVDCHSSKRNISCTGETDLYL